MSNSVKEQVKGGMGHQFESDILKLSKILGANFVLKGENGADFLVKVKDEEVEQIVISEDEFKAQSESAVPVPQDTEDTSNQKEQNVQFNDDLPQKSVLYGVPVSDDTYERGVQSGSQLADFLKRPAEIFKITWAAGGAFVPLRFSPWEKFLLNPFIAQKLRTYKLLRGTLHIKILVNGAPFNYGRMFIGMRPTRFTNNTYNLAPDDSVAVNNYVNSLLVPAPWFPNRVLYSSRPHVFINPSKSEPVHIHWPFMSSIDWIEANRDSDYARLGYLEVWELNELLSSNTGVTPSDIDITFFAWMDNVELTGITPAFFAQSSVAKKKKKNSKKSKNRSVPPSSGNDEFSGDGIVSGPATVIAGIANRLVDVPVIGKFAKATEIGANAVSGIAKLFGFSNPTIVDKVCMVSPITFGRMAHVNGADPCVKLSLDPKNELTIDPSTVGLPNEDGMAFLDVAKREALFYTFQWTTQPTDFRILGHRVHPLIGPMFTHINETSGVYSPTPVAFIALPFQRWTGSLIFRYQFVCSQYHRGRVALVYTPDVGVTLTSLDIVSHYVHIIDLSSETDASFQVNWAQPWAWANVPDRNLLPISNQYDIAVGASVGSLNNPQNECNGRLDLFVINELSGPSATSAIEFNMYVRAGDDFKVADPAPRIGGSDTITYTLDGGTYDLTAQGDTVTTKAYDSLPNEDAGNQETEYIMNGDPPGQTNLNLVYMGEDIRSIRSMIKRYCYYVVHQDLNSSGSTDSPLTIVQMPNFPMGPSDTGYGTSGTIPAVFGGTEFLIMTYLRYYCQAFIGYRGSIKYKIVVAATSAVGFTSVTRDLRRFATKDMTHNIDRYGTGTGASIAQSSFNACFLNSCGGIHVQDMRSTNTLSYELPYYYPTRYTEIHSISTNPNNAFTPFQSHSLCYTQGAVVSNNSNGTQAGYSVVFVAGGEDLSFFFFIGCPPIIVTR